MKRVNLRYNFFIQFQIHVTQILVTSMPSVQELILRLSPVLVHFLSLEMDSHAQVKQHTCCTFRVLGEASKFMVYNVEEA